MNPALRPLITLLAEQLIDAHLRAPAEESRTPAFDRPPAPAHNPPRADGEPEHVGH